MSNEAWNERIGWIITDQSYRDYDRSITKWTKARDKPLNRLISYIHHTCQYKQYCHVGNTAKQCRLGLFQDSDFAGDLEDSKSTSGGTLCVFGSHTFVPISWMRKKQTALSHSSTESEIISLDTGLRLDGLPALELWDLIVSVHGNVSRVSDRSGHPDNDVHKHHKSQKRINVMENIDAVPSNVQSSRQEALLFVFEDNEAVMWKSEVTAHDRSGRPDKTSWKMIRKVRRGHEEILLDGTAQSVRNEETLRDRSVRPDIDSQEGAWPQQNVVGNDETELELSVESRSFVNRVNDQVRKRQKRISNVTEDGEEHSMIW